MTRKLILILLAAVAACQASVLNVTIAPDTLSGNPGDVVKFFGTLANPTGSTVFVNSDLFTFAITGAVDDSPFLTFAPLSLVSLEVSSSFEFLDVTIPPGQGPGIYDGVFTVFGGDTDTASNNLGSAAFHVNVNSIAPTAPEPGSLLLMAGGIAGLLWRRRRRA